MDATPTEKSDQPDPQLAAQASRARTILFAVTAVMMLLPILLFLAFHT